MCVFRNLGTEVLSVYTKDVEFSVSGWQLWETTYMEKVHPGSDTLLPFALSWQGHHITPSVYKEETM